MCSVLGLARGALATPNSAATPRDPYQHADDEPFGGCRWGVGRRGPSSPDEGFFASVRPDRVSRPWDEGKEAIMKRNMGTVDRALRTFAERKVLLETRR